MLLYPLRVHGGDGSHRSSPEILGIKREKKRLNLKCFNMTYVFLTILCRQTYANLPSMIIRDIAFSDISELRINHILISSLTLTKAVKTFTEYKSINRFFLAYL